MGHLRQTETKKFPSLFSIFYRIQISNRNAYFQDICMFVRLSHTFNLLKSESLGKFLFGGETFFKHE